MNYQTLDDIAIARYLLSPPGDTLAELLDERNISQQELSERMGRPLKTINEIIKAKTAITPDTARQLEKTLGTKATFWLERERTFRLALAELDEAEKNLAELVSLQQLPIKEMQRVGWISKTDSPLSNLDAILRFFAVASIRLLPDFLLKKQKIAVNFRKDAHFSTSDWAMETWLRHGEREAETQKLSDFNKKEFEIALVKIREIAHAQPADFKQKLVEIAASTGVAVVFSQCLKGAQISGAARWVRGRPIIQLSGRYKTNDRFWFTFFHEAGHIFLHDKKMDFLDDAEGYEMDAQKEAEADQFAAEWLIPAKIWAEIDGFSDFKKKTIVDFAKKNKLHPAFIVGRLQKLERLDYFKFNDLKIDINLFD